MRQNRPDEKCSVCHPQPGCIASLPAHCRWSSGHPSRDPLAGIYKLAMCTDRLISHIGDENRTLFTTQKMSDESHLRKRKQAPDCIQSRCNEINVGKCIFLVSQLMFWTNHMLRFLSVHAGGLGRHKGEWGVLRGLCFKRVVGHHRGPLSGRGTGVLPC